jgi:hypothetical protein
LRSLLDRLGRWRGQFAPPAPEQRLVGRLIVEVGGALDAVNADLHAAYARRGRTPGAEAASDERRA